MAMTSFSGCLYSLDDFYTVSSGLVTTETTLFVYNTSLLERVTPDTLWEPVRAMVANRMAEGGEEWSTTFERFNSGTYNNQWMVVDYNRLDGQDGLLWVVEQLPGLVVKEDRTRDILQKGYWASYNRAVSREVFVKSGGQEKVEEFGDWFSYNETPRLGTK